MADLEKYTYDYKLRSRDAEDRRNRESAKKGEAIGGSGDDDVRLQ